MPWNAPNHLRIRGGLNILAASTIAAKEKTSRSDVTPGGGKMQSASRARLVSMMSCAIGVASISGTVRAQERSDATLEEVTVTATRVSDSVNRVPLAVTAQTQKALDQQGI